MKRLLLCVIACWITAFVGLTGTPSYEKAMQQALEQLSQANSPEAFRAVANQFERIAQAEENEWLPRYYAAYSYIIQGAMSQDGSQSDQYLDQAQEYLDQAQRLRPEDSEVVALQGYLHMIRVAADPANRGPELAPQATQVLARAVQMNPGNPRALLLLGQMQYGTAQFFDSDTSEACGLIGQALEKFEKAKPESSLHPSWGKHLAEEMQHACEQ
jgi:tetratricopeptide (TPR) repeat protein